MPRFVLICINLALVPTLTATLALTLAPSLAPSLAPTLAPSAHAESLAEAEQACAGELLQGARIACLGSLAERREMAMEARIASTLAGLQAAAPAELRALAIRYREAQAAWRAAVEQDCADEDKLYRELCRLAATLAREEEVGESLARASADLGGGPEALRPEGVEVWVPVELPHGAGRRGVDAGVPIWVPILP